MKIEKKYMFGFLAFALVAMVSAGLVNYYGSVEQNVNVIQGLTIDGQPWDTVISEDMATTSFQNSVFMSVHYLDNDASIDASVTMDTSCSGTNSCTEIVTTHYPTNLRSGELILSQKNIEWNEAGTNKITVSYSTDVNTGVMRVTDIAWGDVTDYTLIYYADEEFNDKGERLATPGQAYELVKGGIIPISSDDGNLKSGADYCTSDSYDHCKGIKIWAIDDAVSEDNIIAWSSDWQSTYYFETDMLGWNHDNGLIGAFDVSSNSELDFVIVSDFPIGVKSGDYTLTTTTNLA